MSKKVSVIVPIYNVAKYLPDCIDSILQQTYSNLEVILVDDGSTDDSGNICDKYTKKDGRIKVIHQKNRGQSAARNAGILKATGDYISFVDGDDEIRPDFVKKLVSAFDENAALSVCGMHYKRLKQGSSRDVYVSRVRAQKKRETKKAYVLFLLATDGRMYSSVNKLYRAEVAKKIKFDEKINFAEDTKFVLDYLDKTTGAIAFVLKPLYVYNFGTENSTISATATSWNNWQDSYKNLKKWVGTHGTLQEKFWLRVVLLRWRISFVRSKKRAKA